MSAIPAIPQPPIEVRLLRHHTRTALDSILAQVSLGGDGVGLPRQVVAEVERRIALTSEIADALFGVTRPPGPFPDRLLTLCEAVVRLVSDSDQDITLLCQVENPVPERLQEPVLKVAREFVGNAVKHGMCMRMIGRIDVVVASHADGVVLEVSDDGWGCAERFDFGEGLEMAEALAKAVGGWIEVGRQEGVTIAEMIVPLDRHDA